MQSSCLSLRKLSAICRVQRRCIAALCYANPTEERFTEQVAALIGVRTSRKQPTADKRMTLYLPWKIRQLDDEESIVQAKALLYQVYIREMGWMFAKNNPTGFEITTSRCGKKLLTDKIESHSTWYGVTHRDQVVAVMRRVHRDNEGHLDMTRYASCKKPSLKKLLCPITYPRLVELQRCAVQKRYRGTNVLPCLFHHLFVQALQTDSTIVGTSPVGKMKIFLSEILKLTAIDHEFLYTENREGPSTVFQIPTGDLLGAIEILERRIKQSRGIQPRL